MTNTELKVVMFTDQVKSTAATARRTPAEITEVAREQDDLTAEVVKQCRGTILKDTGDGHFIEFFACADAVRCGFLIQRRVRERNEAQTNARLRVGLHVGIDFGEAVVLPNGDLRANTANLAARVCSVCPEGDVFFTEKVSKELHRDEASFARVEVDPAKLKGVRGRVKIFRLVEWLGAIDSAPNPFIWRDGITNPADFFDRENEQRTLRAYLRGRQNCQVVGPRRMSKTSLLRRIGHRAKEWDASSVVAYVDLQDPRCFTLPGWLQQASRQLHRPAPAASLAEFTEHVEEMLNGGRRPVLCLDEFEELTKRRDEFTRDFFLTLRACGQMGMSIITASGKSLSELTESRDPTSPFYNTFPLLRLGPFAPPDAADFVNHYRAGVPPFTPEECAAILGFAKGHPLALQVACFHVLEARESDASLTTAIQNAADEMRVLLPRDQ